MKTQTTGRQPKVELMVGGAMVEIGLVTPGGRLTETVEEEPRLEKESQRARVKPRIQGGADGSGNCV